MRTGVWYVFYSQGNGSFLTMKILGNQRTTESSMFDFANDCGDPRLGSVLFDHRKGLLNRCAHSGDFCISPEGVVYVWKPIGTVSFDTGTMLVKGE